MGAWGTGNFENDYTFMWLDEFLRQPTRQVLMKTFETVVNTDIQMDDGTDFLDSDESWPALAAAEIVAALMGKPGKDFPLEADEEEDKWDEISKINLDESLRESAIAAIKRILYMKGHSEVRELWQESNDYTEWKSLQEDLLRRLRGRLPFRF